eukprot:symbB.v1.2.006654.t1/scaffold372.1/size218212/6
MLGRLFVENFDLRRKLRGSQGEHDASQSESSSQVPVALDLSRFAMPEGADSDDESLVPSDGKASYILEASFTRAKAEQHTIISKADFFPKKFALGFGLQGVASCRVTLVTLSSPKAVAEA